MGFSLGLGGGVLFAFSASSTIFDVYRVGHFEKHISEFSSKFFIFRSPTAGRYTMMSTEDPFNLTTLVVTLSYTVIPSHPVEEWVTCESVNSYASVRF